MLRINSTVTTASMTMMNNPIGPAGAPSRVSPKLFSARISTTLMALPSVRSQSRLSRRLPSGPRTDFVGASSRSRRRRGSAHSRAYSLLDAGEQVVLGHRIADQRPRQLVVLSRPRLLLHLQRDGEPEAV